jgi:hypothetical protein
MEGEEMFETYNNKLLRVAVTVPECPLFVVYRYATMPRGSILTL